MPALNLATAVLAAGTLLISPLLPAAPTPAPEPVVAAPALTASASHVQGQKVMERPAHGDTAQVDDAGTFKGAGVSWDASGPEVTQVMMRLKAAHGGYGPWESMEIYDVDTVREGRRAANALLSVDDADAVQVRVSTVDGADAHNVRIHLVSPGTLATDATPTGRTVAAVSLSSSQVDRLKPAVMTRAQWGADESKRTWHPSAITPKAVAIHHTASSNNYTPAQAPEQLRSIYLYHAVSLGWGDIGYSFLVDKYGTAYEGQYGSLEQIHTGGHTSGYNSQVLGISAIGNYETAAAPQAMVDKIEALAAWQMAKYGIDPTGQVSLTNAGGKSNVRVPVGSSVLLPAVFGHYSTSYTACPGVNLIQRLPQIRQDVARIVTAAGSTTATTSPVATPSTATKPAPSPAAGTYTVRAGDGWWLISSRTNVSASRLQQLNGLSATSMLHPGQVLKTGAVSSPAPAPSPTASGAGTYTVRAGDGWWLISSRTNVSASRLQQLNGLSATSMLHPGQVLKTGAATTAPAPATSGTYTVRAGDGWWLISSRTGVSASRLQQLNGLSAVSMLHPGQVLKTR